MSREPHKLFLAPCPENLAIVLFFLCRFWFIMAAHRNIWLPDSIIFLVRFSLFPRDFFLRSTISLNPIRDLAA